MEIKQSGSQPSAKGPAKYLSGTVHVEFLFASDEQYLSHGRVK